MHKRGVTNELTVMVVSWTLLLVVISRKKGGVMANIVKHWVRGNTFKVTIRMKGYWVSGDQNS